MEEIRELRKVKSAKQLFNELRSLGESLLKKNLDDLQGFLDILDANLDNTEPQKNEDIIIGGIRRANQDIEQISNDFMYANNRVTEVVKKDVDIN